MYHFYKTTLIAALVATCGILTSTAITAEPRSTPQPGEGNSIVLPTSANGILSQCGDIYTFSPEEDIYGVVPEEYDKNFIPVHRMIVPVFGYMVDAPFPVEEAMKLKHGENPYKIAEINRAMWEGHTFIWVSKTVPAETFDYVQSYANTWNESHEEKVIALTWEWDKADGKPQLPMKRDFAFGSWSISQSCKSFSETTFEEFLEKAAEHNVGRDTEEIPTAKLADGELAKP